MIVIGREEVAEHLDFPTCITLMRDAMIALSAGRTRQLLRQIIDLDGKGNAFGVMPGAMDDLTFGAKLISVYPAISPRASNRIRASSPCSIPQPAPLPA